jgi:hypothetical protein
MHVGTRGSPARVQFASIAGGQPADALQRRAIRQQARALLRYSVT